MREIITAPLPGLDLRRHYGHYQSPAIRAGGLIFCSGMIAVDPQTGERRHGTLSSEAQVIFGNLKLLLESAGSSLDRLVQVHALIHDNAEYDVLNRVYQQSWRTARLRALCGACLPDGARVVIECTALA